MGIKRQEDEEGTEKEDGVREKRDERMMEGGKISEAEVSQQNSYDLQPVMSFLMTVIRTD